MTLDGRGATRRSEGFAPVPQGYNNYRPTLGPREQPKAVADMGALEQLDAGVMASLGRTGRGTGQLIGLGLDALDGGNRADKMQAAEAQIRAQEADLLNTGWGRAGSIAGDVGQALLPIGRAANLSRGRQVVAGGATGAGIGLLQPTVEGESRTLNAVTGGAAGTVGSAVAPLVGRAVGATLRPLQAFTERGANRQAREVVRNAASDTASLSRSAPSAIPGVQRTLAEETLDPGIAQLQRQFPVELADLSRSNNNVRVDFLASAFGGADDAAAAAIRESADAQAQQAARGLRGVVNAPAQHNPFAGLGVKAAPQEQAITLDPLVKWTDALIKKNDRRPVVQSALSYVRDLSARPVGSAQEAWNLRKTINDLMEGRVGGDQAAAKAARKELISVRNLLDRQMTKAYPDWGKFLRDYKGAMREADQVDVGAFLLKRGGVEGVDGSGAAVRALQPAKFRNLTDDMDRAVQGATGFKRATASGALTPEQMGAVGSVRDDVIRMIEADRLAKAVGSPTSQNLRTEGKIMDAMGARAVSRIEGVPLLGPVVSGINRAAEERVRQSVAQILANPQQGRKILEAAPLIERQAIEAALLQAGGASSIGLLNQF